MKVRAKWHHVIEVTREVEIDEAAFTMWRIANYGEDSDVDLALAVWIDGQDTDFYSEVFKDWRTSDPLPDDFELAYSEVIDAEHESTEPQEHAARWDGESRPYRCEVCGARVVSRLESWVHISTDL